ncbi:MAG: glycosyltransferase family 4 protein [bacterium]|nr:glycosyltransferase family 4 protein [bacterium]
MRILFVIPVYTDKIGGRERYLYKISEELSGEYDVEVVTRFDTPFNYFASSNRFLANSKNKTYFNGKIKINVIGINFFEKIWLLPVYKLYFNLKTQKVAKWLYNKVWVKKIIPFVKSADVVEYHGTGQELLSFGVLESCRILNKPFIVLPHSHPGSWGDWGIDIELYKSADRIIVNSESEKQFMVSKEISVEKIRVIYGAPIIETKTCHSEDGKYFRKKYNITGDMILFVGRKIKGKGYVSLIKAMDLVWKDNPETYFVFIGSGESIYSLQDKRVIELGWCDEFEKISAYKACDIFCMPSYEEAFGIVYTEAWMFGKPVIGGNIPALKEVISEGVDGLLVKQDPEDIAAAILKLLNDKSLRDKMGIAGKKKVDEKFNWNKIISDIKSLYNSLT